MNMMKKAIAIMAVMVAVAVTVFAGDRWMTPKIRGTTEVDYFYVGNKDDETAMKKVRIYCANRRALDKAEFKGLTKRIAEEIRANGNIVLDLSVYSQRYFKEGTENRYVDHLMTFETHFVHTPAGLYIYAFVITCNKDGSVKEEYKTDTYYTAKEWTDFYDGLLTKYGLTEEDQDFVLGTKTR